MWSGGGLRLPSRVEWMECGFYPSLLRICLVGRYSSPQTKGTEVHVKKGQIRGLMPWVCGGSRTRRDLWPILILINVTSSRPSWNELYKGVPRDCETKRLPHGCPCIAATGQDCLTWPCRGVPWPYTSLCVPHIQPRLSVLHLCSVSPASLRLPCSS